MRASLAKLRLYIWLVDIPYVHNLVQTERRNNFHILRLSLPVPGITFNLVLPFPFLLSSTLQCLQRCLSRRTWCSHLLFKPTPSTQTSFKSHDEWRAHLLLRYSSCGSVFAIGECGLIVLGVLLSHKQSLLLPCCECDRALLL